MSSSEYDSEYESEPASSSSPVPPSNVESPSPTLFTLDSNGEVQLSSAGRQASLLPSSSSSTGPSVPPSYLVTPELANRLLRVYQAIEDRPLHGEKTYSRSTEMQTVAEFRGALLDMMESPLQPDPFNKEIVEAGKGMLGWSVELRRQLPRLPLEIHRRIAQLGPDYPPSLQTYGGRWSSTRTNKKHIITAALVCRDWKSFAIPLLYSSINLDPLERYQYSTGLDSAEILAKALLHSGNGPSVFSLSARGRHQEDICVSFLGKSGPLPHLLSLSRLIFPPLFVPPSYGGVDLLTLAPSLRRLEIQVGHERFTSPYPHYLLLPPTLETVGLEGTAGAMAPSVLNDLWTSFEHLSNISTLEISNYTSSFYSPPLQLTSSTLGPFNSLGNRITRLILNQVTLTSSFLTSLSETYPSLLVLGLSLLSTKLPSDPTDAILSHPLLETLEVDDEHGRGIEEVIEWLKFLYRPSKNLLKVPKLSKIKIVPNFVWEFEPDVRSEGKTFDILKGLWDMWLEVEDSRGSIWDAEWAEELERDT